MMSKIISIAPYLGAFIALISYSSLPVIAKAMNSPLPPFTFVASVNFFILIIALPMVLYETSIAGLSYKMTELKGILIFSLVNIVAFLAFLFATSRLPVMQYQIFIMLSPLVGGMGAYLFLGETFKIQYLVSYILVLSGLWISLKAD